MSKYACPDCGLQFASYKLCKQHVTETGHADSGNSKGLQQRCMTAHPHADDSAAVGLPTESAAAKARRLAEEADAQPATTAAPSSFSFAAGSPFEAICLRGAVCVGLSSGKHPPSDPNDSQQIQFSSHHRISSSKHPSCRSLLRSSCCHHSRPSFSSSHIIHRHRLPSLRCHPSRSSQRSFASGFSSC